MWDLGKGPKRCFVLLCMCENILATSAPGRLGGRSRKSAWANKKSPYHKKTADKAWAHHCQQALLAGRLASKGCPPFLQHLRSKGEAARWVLHSGLQDSQDYIWWTLSQKPNQTNQPNDPKTQTKRMLYYEDEEDFFFILPLQLSLPYSSLLYSMINISKV